MAKTKMSFERARELLDEVNAVIAEYDPVLKEKARDILLEVLFGNQIRAVRRGSGPEAGFRGRPEIPLPTAGDGPGSAVDFPEILERWNPQRASEKALLAAYFLDRFRRQPTLTSQRINAILKQHGLTVSNITRAIETNLRASPPLMEQIRKRGTTRQARKEYLLTDAGERMVEERLRSGRQA